jgi:hypothetical protein
MVSLSNIAAARRDETSARESEREVHFLRSSGISEHNTATESSDLNSLVFSP